MTNETRNQKVYAFVDESGQETLGALFLVSVVVTDQEYETLNDLLLEIEQQSKKGQSKWGKTRFEYRVAYISAVIAHASFKELIFFSQYTQTKAYFDLTVATTAKALAHKNQEDRPVTVIVDGLTGKSIDRFKRGLRAQQINVRKVKGARDEAEPLVRLADAVAGFLRDFLGGQKYAASLYQQARQGRIIQEL